MTRAETIAAIKKEWPLHVECPNLIEYCPDCTIAWLLQEIEYLEAKLKVERDITAVTLNRWLEDRQL